MSKRELKELNDKYEKLFLRFIDTFAQSECLYQELRKSKTTEEIDTILADFRKKYQEELNDKSTTTSPE